LVGEHARAEVQTPAAVCVTLYCTWQLSALTTGQVAGEGINTGNI